MRPRYLLVVLLACAAGYWDASVISWFTVPFSAMRFVLAFSILLALFSSGYSKSIIAALVGGLVADLLLPSQGYLAIRVVIAVIVVHTLARHLFTNRSFWGICFLGSIAVCVDRGLLFIMNQLPLFSGGPRTIEAHAPIWMEIIWMCLVCSSAFLFFAAFSRRFHPTLSRIDQMNRIPWG
jgi:hypothetical protein